MSRLQPIFTLFKQTSSDLKQEIREKGNKLKQLRITSKCEHLFQNSALKYSKAFWKYSVGPITPPRSKSKGMSHLRQS